MNDIKHNNLRVRFLVIICMLFVQLSYGQLSNFDLTVVSTNETCSGNGGLTFTTANTTAGATIVYTIFKLPNTTNPISTQSTNTLGGLVAATYLVIATQTLGNDSGIQQQNITITSSIVPLTFQLIGTPGVCQNGSITVQVLTGTAATYQILSGPVIVGSQTSNVFNLLPPGTYQIRVNDICGEGVVQNYTIAGSTPGMAIGAGLFPDAKLPACDGITIQHQLSAPTGTVLAYPLLVEYTIFPPSGAPIVITQTIPTGSPAANPLGNVIPFYAAQPYSYNIKITDGCGNIYTRNNNIVDRTLTVTLTSVPKECTKALNITPNNYFDSITVTFLSAPAGFDPLTFNGGHPGPFSQAPQYFNSTVPMPEGLYVVQITDECGRTATGQLQFTQDITVFPLSSTNRKGCDSNSGSVLLSSFNGSLVSVSIISAPAGYPVALPQDVSFNIATNGNFFMNSLPAGNYTFNTVDSCANQLNATVTVQGEQTTVNDVTITPNCSSFNLALHHVSNVATQSEQFWLQKLNTETNEWGNPQTGYSDGLMPSTANALILANNTTNVNLPYTGTFRILKTFDIYSNGQVFVSTCSKEIYDFEFTGVPKIDAVYSFSCSNNTTDVVVVASGLAPLTYRIISKDGAPFSVENGTSNLFEGLDPGIYGFQVEDSCGNRLGRFYDVTVPLALSITSSNLCDGQNGTLSVPALSFLNFQWWEGNNTANILSTSNSLAFAPFNAATDSGVYHVRLSYPNSNSCIDVVLDFTISTGLSNPNAGTGTDVSYCGNQGDIDLFTLLSGPHDTFGTWQEITTSGNLSNSIWDSSDVEPGIYQFMYTVNGLCNAVDDATINITIKILPETPTASVEQSVCATQNLHLFSTAIDNVTYQWTGPNGFTSNEQNPVIPSVSAANNGTYSVSVLPPGANACPSGTSSVEVAVNTSPNFTLQANCDNNVYTVTATPENNSFDPDAVTYSWTGPEGFTSNVNPILITGLPAGNYELTVTDANCFFTLGIDIGTTICTIPLGVSPNDDGDNDNFDLSGFDVEHLKIFNRYGMVVYERANYIDQWNGQDYLGHNLPGATYFYLIRLASGEAKSGWVYLIRKN
jgi:gliding motility-associated-like protein